MFHLVLQLELGTPRTTGGEPPPNIYLRPGGTFHYCRPDGTSYYTRP